MHNTVVTISALPLRGVEPMTQTKKNDQLSCREGGKADRNRDLGKQRPSHNPPPTTARGRRRRAAREGR